MAPLKLTMFYSFAAGTEVWKSKALGRQGASLEREWPLLCQHLSFFSFSLEILRVQEGWFLSVSFHFLWP